MEKYRIPQAQTEMNWRKIEQNGEKTTNTHITVKRERTNTKKTTTTTISKREKLKFTHAPNLRVFHWVLYIFCLFVVYLYITQFLFSHCIHQHSFSMASTECVLFGVNFHSFVYRYFMCTLLLYLVIFAYFFLFTQHPITHISLALSIAYATFIK